MDPTGVRTHVQGSEGVAASAELSLPKHVQQHSSAPKVGGFILMELLGEGAYGQVWRAWQNRTRKEVAVKIFLQRSGLDWIFLQREVERLTRLDKHPHIVTLLDTNLEEEPPFYVMELLGGGSLQQHVSLPTRADAARGAAYMRQIADALSYVHGKGLIHCDLKPANILVDERASIRVVDFGQSRVFSESAASLGTLFYMAPEQAVPAQLGSPIQPDVRWDVYALGATTFAILSGRVPYATPEHVQALEQAPNLTERLSRYREILHRNPRPDWGGEVTVGREMRAVVEQCMAPAAADRYANVGEVLADFEAMERRRPVKPLTGYAVYRWRKFVQRNLLRLGLAFAAIIAMVLGGWAFWQTNRLERARASELLSMFAHDPKAATPQAVAATGLLRRHLHQMVGRAVTSAAYTERVTGARAALLIQPDAFWESVDRGPLWTYGEWVEVARAFGRWPEPSSLTGPDAGRLWAELHGTIRNGSARQKYAALGIAGLLRDPSSGFPSVVAQAAQTEADAGVSAAAFWAGVQFGAVAPPRTTEPFFADEVSRLVFVRLPATQSFLHGSPLDDPDRFPDEEQRQVGPIASFRMSVTEVTLASLEPFWKEKSESLGFSGTDRTLFVSQFAGLPADETGRIAAGYVSVRMARAYCEWLNRRAAGTLPSRRYRLPSEAEWEYACRAGSRQRFGFGDDASYVRYFAHCDGSPAERHTVAQRMPNAFGLFDMHGGLWELTGSRYPEEFAPPEFKGRELYVQRGGAWSSAAVRCRSAQRNFIEPQALNFYTGVRLVMEMDP